MAADPVWRKLVGRPVRMEEARRIASAQGRVHGGTQLPHRTHRAIRLRRLPRCADSPGEVTGQRRPARVAPSGHPAGGQRRGRGPPPGMVRAGASRAISASSSPDAGSRNSSTARPHVSGAPSPSARRQSRTPAPQCLDRKAPGLHALAGCVRPRSLMVLPGPDGAMPTPARSGVGPVAVWVPHDVHPVRTVHLPPATPGPHGGALAGCRLPPQARLQHPLPGQG